MCTQNLMKFCIIVIMILSRSENLTSIKDHDSVKILLKMASKNANLDLVNINLYTKNGKILSMKPRPSPFHAVQ